MAPFILEGLSFLINREVAPKENFTYYCRKQTEIIEGTTAAATGVVSHGVYLSPA